MSRLTILALTALCSRCLGDFTLSNNVYWTLRSADNTIVVPGSVPGEVHTDLMNAHEISSDPYFRYNELNMSWVALSEVWTYESSEFDMPESDMLWNMKLQGIDSISSVYLNNHLVGKTDNVFRSFTFPVHEYLRSERNILKIVLHGVTQYVKSKAADYPYEVPETENYNVWAEPTNRNFVRKPGSDFGWDWGPAFIPAGIYGDILFFQSQAGRLEQILVHQKMVEENFRMAQVDVSVLVSSVLTTSSVAISVYWDDQLCLAGEFTVSSTAVGSTTTVAVGQIMVPDPVLWWPRGFGDPHLYSIEVIYEPMGVNSRSTQMQKLTRKTSSGSGAR